MDIKIKNAGSGPDIGAHVDQNNQLHAFVVDSTVVQDATNKGNAYNINTGLIGLTSTSESAVFYFKNDEALINGESSFIIDAIIIGIDNEGTTAGMSLITLVENPTAGTIVSGASVAPMIKNRKFGSNNTLDSIIYKGAEGNTFTDGEDFGIILQSPGTRATYPVDIELTKGTSFGIKMDTDTSAGTTNVYVAVVGHKKDGKNA